METPKKRLPFPWLFRWRFWRLLTLTLAILVTIFALFSAEETWRGKRAWENYKREKAASGEVLDFSRFIPPPVPDDQNFAMTPFLAPMFDFVPGTQTQRDTNGWKKIDAKLPLANDIQAKLGKAKWTQGKPLDLAEIANDILATNHSTTAHFQSGQTQEAAKTILAFFETSQPVIDELRTAAQRPYSRFNIRYDWEPKYEILLPHLATINKTCSILELRASSDLALEQSAPAFRDTTLMFRMIWSIRDEPFLITHLVRVSCLVKTLQPIWEGIAKHQWTEEQLSAFTQDLGKLDFISDGIRSLHAEKDYSKSFFDQLRSSRNPFRTANEIGNGVPSLTSDDIPGVIVGLLVPSGWYCFEELNYHRLYAAEMEGVLESTGVDPDIAERRFADVQNQLSDAGLGILQHQAVARMLLPSLGNFELKIVRAQTYANLAKIACALERHQLAHGSYPETLDALVPQFLQTVPRDLILGQSLKYRASNGTFILYSVGWDKKDDGGIAVKEGEERTRSVYYKGDKQHPQGNDERSSGDWVWSYPDAKTTSPQ